MSTKLFLIISTDDNGDDVSAIVEATDANDAVNQWHAWLVHFRCYSAEDETPDRSVFQLPEKKGSSGFFGWHDQDGVIEYDI